MKAIRVAYAVLVVLAANSVAGARPDEMGLAWVRDELHEAPTDDALGNWIKERSPILWDWLLQDGGDGVWPAVLDADEGARTLRRRILERVIENLGPNRADLAREVQQTDASESMAPHKWLDLYVRACLKRRELRFAALPDGVPSVVFTKHHNLGGSHYAYTEAQSDAQSERNFRPGAALCRLDMDGLFGRVTTLLESADGVIRDPDVYYDGRHILFAWKKSDWDDDFHLYEMSTADRAIRQITSGAGFADYEGAYLPNGDLIFNSTRCVQTVDCWWTEVSNLYTCDRQGRYLRRLTFDQVHTNYPTVTADGRVLYTRWDYNDRGQLFPQPLFVMNADGTAQAAYYGGNSWFPTTILHAREMPGGKIIAIATGHHTYQAGKLIRIDAAKGREENAGVEMLAPVRPSEAVRVDYYGQDGELFQYPYPLTDDVFLVAYSPLGGAPWDALFGIYLMDVDGRRELLAFDGAISCNQPVPLAPRPVPHVQPSLVDYRRSTGTYYVQDVYAGPGLQGVPRGTVKRLRVVAIEYRAAGIGENYNVGPGGDALVSTPISIDNGSWDVKVVLGDAKVYADGSACFEVPARTPVYFQVLDAKNRVVQSMRSWSTLQPGETASCVGCHESRNETPRVTAQKTLAMRAGPQPLEPFYGPPRGFSYLTEIQPIWNRHCTSCHNGRPGDNVDARAARLDLRATPVLHEVAKRRWVRSYLTLTQHGKPNRIVNWLNVQSVPTMLPPYEAGSARSELLTILEKGHYDVKLSAEELDKIACWIDLLVPFCGDYREAHAWSEEEIRKYEHFLEKRKDMEVLERSNIAALLADRAGPSGG
ncbi:MAG TPA: hypothetical protein P5279_04205 [Anaerohalosphaeraceae bacterium]|nr:hypothetical protein [Anaerohalosphaeraceae bacterium]HRT49673.1 hypothetical protein [Anaerohalosphaeraceae bacterium]HRT85990.1 hypothetical protein [Anaerohalosphaeraceae bacterium]